MATDNLTALDALTRARINIRAARVDALTAAVTLTDARKTRADELAEKLADCLAFVKRLCVVVEGDYRAEQG